MKNFASGVDIHHRRKMKNLIYKSAAMTFAIIALFLAAATSTQAQTEREIREMIPERE